MKSSKDVLRKKFSHEPGKYYKVRLFEELGFMRKKCPSCGKHFWTLNTEQNNCPDQPCTSYSFIGNPPAKTNLDYIQIWKAVEKFFTKNGHESIPSYPTVCRWFPGLYFTIASIVAFQRSVGGETTFEMPANPLVIPQVCFRFPDIENVGLSGRHLTSFVMIGQHSIYNPVKKEGYWKDRCMELDWKLLTDVFRIKPDDISFTEDVWVGPAAFGYSLEYFVRGLELGNAVFTEFVGTTEKYRTMDNKIIDMGAGLERFAWLLHGTDTINDAAHGPVIKKLKAKIDYDGKLFSEFSKFSGIIDVEDGKDVSEIENSIAKKIGVDIKTLKKGIRELQAVYAISDHAKTLLYGMVDGQLPSNVGGGYNLRVILRRALGFIDEYKLDIDIYDVCKLHAKYLKPMDPRLSDNLGGIDEILKIEKNRFIETRSRAINIITDVISKERNVSANKMAELYESNGITPELVNEVARIKNISISIPSDFYAKISQKHIQEKDKEKVLSIDLSDLPETKTIFYDNQNQKDFSATVLRTDKDWVILDQTAFFAESGGQSFDMGTLNEKNVTDVQKFGKTIAHKVERHDMKKGMRVFGTVDMDRRKQLMQHHTAVHVVNGVARKILGNHVWQAGASKALHKAHLDITHYKSLTENEIEKIEEKVNDIIKKSVTVIKTIVPRVDAERKYGFIIYQGGVVPEKYLRMVEIPGLDVEACGGIHVVNTRDIDHVVIISTERTQDGIVRINLAAGEAARAHINKNEHIVSTLTKLLNTTRTGAISKTKRMLEEWKILRKTIKDRAENIATSHVEDISKRFVNNILIERIDGVDMEYLRNISKKLSGEGKFLLLFGVRGNDISIFSSSGVRDINAGKIVNNSCKELGGGGGGPLHMGQGVGRDIDKLDDLVNDLKRKFKVIE
ncbi:MAG: alanine--tRNA ligase [Candidatus Aenigmatarchaeota archaeon]